VVLPSLDLLTNRDEASVGGSFANTLRHQGLWAPAGAPPVSDRGYAGSSICTSENSSSGTVQKGSEAPAAKPYRLPEGTFRLVSLSVCHPNSRWSVARITFRTISRRSTRSFSFLGGFVNRDRDLDAHRDVRPSRLVGAQLCAATRVNLLKTGEKCSRKKIATCTNFANLGNVQQNYRTAFTRQKSLVRTQHRPPIKSGVLQVKCRHPWLCSLSSDGTERQELAVARQDQP
jgi:hypothetical protein